LATDWRDGRVCYSGFFDFYNIKQDACCIEGGMSRIVVFGIGGYDPSKPNDNIVEIIDTPDEAEANEVFGIEEENNGY
jgi:hypothetical protein